jgi:hypothetical protein
VVEFAGVHGGIDGGSPRCWDQGVLIDELRVDPRKVSRVVRVRLQESGADQYIDLGLGELPRLITALRAAL